MALQRPRVLQIALIACLASISPASAADAAPREKVDGIGGFFFRAQDPKKLALWYKDELGITTVPTSYGDKPWQQTAGATAFMPFRQSSTYFDVSKPFELNFRVSDLDKLVAQLRADGIDVKVDPATYPNGRFAHLADPEDNPIELWQPMEPAATQTRH